MMISPVDTQAIRPSLALAVGTREREQTEWIPPNDVSSDPARQRMHQDHAKPCLGRAGRRECPGGRRLRLQTFGKSLPMMSDWVYFAEALPTPGDAVVRAGGHSYVSEFVVELPFGSEGGPVPS